VLDEGRSSDPANLPGVAAVEASSLLDGTVSMDALRWTIDARPWAWPSGHAPMWITPAFHERLSTRLDPSLDLFADVLLHPAFRDADVARRKSRKSQPFVKSRMIRWAGHCESPQYSPTAPIIPTDG